MAGKVRRRLRPKQHDQAGECQAHVDKLHGADALAGHEHVGADGDDERRYIKEHNGPPGGRVGEAPEQQHELGGKQQAGDGAGQAGLATLGEPDPTDQHPHPHQKAGTGRADTRLEDGRNVGVSQFDRDLAAAPTRTEHDHCRHRQGIEARRPRGQAHRRSVSIRCVLGGPSAATVLGATHAPGPSVPRAEENCR